MSNLRLFRVPVEGPPGFIYEPDFITPAEEKTLMAEFKKAPLKTFNFKGYESKRRGKSYTKERGFPTKLRPILERVSKFLKIKLETIEHALISEYIPSTGIGWHRDQPPYDKIIGLSFGTAVPFRFRKLSPIKDKKKWEHITITAEPRSLYVMAGESRSLWQHSIPPVPDWRYSLTMRTITQ
jgi:alkylated DNA repair dioxygenase AlkB